MVVEDNQWTLESPTTISKMGSLSASIATSTDTWQRNADWRKRNEKHKHVLKCDKKGHIAKDCRGKQIIKKRKVQEESDNEDNKEKEQGFGEDLE